MLKIAQQQDNFTLKNTYIIKRPNCQKQNMKWYFKRRLAKE